MEQNENTNDGTGGNKELLLSDLPRLKYELEKDLATLLMKFNNTTGLQVLRIDIEQFRQVGFENRPIQRLSVTVGME